MKMQAGVEYSVDVEVEKDSVKKRYIDAAIAVMEKEGLSAVTARRVSGMVGMNPANIYRHFADLNELRMFASLSILKEYLLAMRAHFSKTQDSYENLIQSWEIFCENAFQNILVFDQMFFGVNRDRLPEIAKEYYELYPEQLEGFDGSWKDVVTSGSFEERCRIALQQCCKAGYFRQDDLETMIEVPRYLFMGYLHEAILSPDDTQKMQRLSQECMNYLKRFFRMHRQR